MKHIFREITDQEYLAFFEKAECANYLQSAEMSRLRKVRGYCTEYVGLFTDEELGGKLVLAALLCSKKSRLGWIFNIDGGPIGDFSHLETFLDKLQPYLQKKSALFCQITPHLVIQNLTSTGEAIVETTDEAEKTSSRAAETAKATLEKSCRLTPYSFSAQLPWQYVKNLDGLDSESLLMSFNQTSRQMYKKGIKSELQITEETDFAVLAALFEQTATRQHFADKGLGYYTKLKQAFGDKAKFLAVHYKDQIIAGGVFIFDRDELIHLFGGSNKEFSNSTGAPTFLQVHAMRMALENGYKKYNFYGISGIFDGSDRILHFKQSFRGSIEHYSPSFDLIINKLKYRLWRALNSKHHSSK